MLVTVSEDREIRGRPMALLDFDNSRVWFVTRLDSGKIRELERDPRVAIIMQGRRKYLSMSGHASLHFDRRTLDEHWRPELGIWFERGREDPAAAMIRVQIHKAEYWDHTGVRLIRYVFDAARSLSQQGYVDLTQEGDTEHHAKVDLSR